MALAFNIIRYKFFQIIPLLLLFIISLNGISVMDFKYFSINLHYILVYFWVLRMPSALGFGFIFLAGLITDVIFGLPMGSSPLALLIVAAVAAYVRNVTVRVSLLNDWVSFIPALLFANLVYFLTLYLSNYSIDYMYLFKNSIFTFIFYPILWSVFSLIINMMKS